MQRESQEEAKAKSILGGDGNISQFDLLLLIPLHSPVLAFGRMRIANVSWVRARF
jgi:hypothetical protein